MFVVLLAVFVDGILIACQCLTLLTSVKEVVQNNKQGFYFSDIKTFYRLGWCVRLVRKLFQETALVESIWSGRVEDFDEAE